MKIAIGQINTVVGDLDSNTRKIEEYYLRAVKDKCDIIAFPELTITGYPLCDLATNKTFQKEVAKKIRYLKKLTVDKKTTLIVGGIQVRNQKLFNIALFIHDGVEKIISKHALPNYGVFDEKRVFSSTRKSPPILFKGHKIGLLICEDIWDYKTPNHLATKGAEILIAINSSPYDLSKFLRRLNILATVQSQTNLPILYINQVGGQDNIVFDGGSIFIDKGGQHLINPVFWEEHYEVVDLAKPKHVKLEFTDSIADIYNALILGIRDYFAKTGFKKAILGSSGGIDSGIVAALAADALGHENVETVMLSSKFTSEESKKDAKALAANIGCKHSELSIAETYDSLYQELESSFVSKKPDTTEENLQARIRGVMLMALSNKLGSLLLSTGNKSEYATGYATLYGDMCGSFAPIKDVYKTQVYELAKWRNSNIPKISKLQKTDIIPQNILTKEPTAELRSNQKDSDTLPQYNILDGILYHIIELNMHPKMIQGFDPKLVKKVYKMFISSEYKRKQSAIGPKVSLRELQLDRRYPIANAF